MNNNLSSTVLACQQLAKSFNEAELRVDVLKNINLAVQAGERIAIVGTSGSGKSTLLHLLGGLDKPSAGQVLLNGHDIMTLSEQARCALRNRTLGFIYQFHHLLPEFTVLENVCMPLLIRGMEPALAKHKAVQLLAKVGLSQREQHRLGELSGGERQRAAIVRALIAEPACVLADEPTGNLDQATAQRVYETMLELNQALNTSLIIVTHDSRLAERMQRVLTLEHGVLKS